MQRASQFGEKKYEHMYSVMTAPNSDVLVKNNDEGIARVLKGGYVFLMESTTIDYNVERNCNLAQIGGTLDRKGYGIAIRRGRLHKFESVSIALSF